MKSGKYNLRKMIAGLMMGSLLFAEIFQPVMAASLAINDVPMAVKNLAQPNFIFVYDDSGSMDFETSFTTNNGNLWWHTGDQRFYGRTSTDASDYVAGTPGTGTINYNSGGQATGSWVAYIYLFPNGTGTGARVFADGANSLVVPPTDEFGWARSSDYNSIYYNTNINYTPWQQSNNGTTTTTWANITATAAPSHAGVTGSVTMDLTTNQTAAVASTNYTFRMYNGMTMPAGAGYRPDGSASGTAFTTLATATVVGTAPLTAGPYDVQIPYYPATFYVKDATGTDGYGPDGSRLKKYEIKSTTASYPSGRTYAAELQNFANWFSYYRKRRLLAGAAIGNALTDVKGIRAGLVIFNNRSNVTMYDFDNASDSLNVKRFLGLIYPLSTTALTTPTKDALYYAGEQFKRTNSGAPIQYACQFNAAFVITDGFAVNDITTSPGNVDGTTSIYSTTKTYGADTFPLFPGATPPTSTTLASPYAPYKDDFGGTLADIAMKYYTDNLRPDLTTSRVPTNKNDTAKNADMNSNLHMNTYAMGLGLKGTIFGTSSASATDPFTTPPNWNTIYSGNDASTYPDRSALSIDDLWHATINGRGLMLSATNPDEVRVGVSAVVNDVLGRVGSAAAVAVANANVTSGDNASYASSYNSGNWTGNLEAFPINLTTGVPDTTAPIWTTSARDQLTARTAASRYIASYTGVGSTGQGIQFQPTTASTTTKLSTTQQTSLNTPSTTDGANVVAYLRGDRSLETSTYRKREYLLGDSVNAEPVIVREPMNSYSDTGYSTFKSTNSGRTKTVFLGSNDGMLHGFNAATGAENWAYIPNIVMSSLNMLSRKTGFTHKYYVDGTPTVEDVDTSNTTGTGTGTWMTLMVGGLAKGGRGYYALDVTTPNATSEGDAANKVLWEFPNSTTSATNVSRMGYSYGKPVIVKTQSRGWVVLVTSGHNNGTDTGGDGHGYLFVLRPTDGSVLTVIDTGVGSAATPSGLGQIAAFVDNGDVDNTTDYVYGGDLLGNVWRFDLTANNPNTWSVVKLAALVDGGGTAQPITTTPELSSIDVGGGSTRRYVYVGTGQYFSDADVSTTQTQTMYGLVDNMANNPLITPLRSSLQQQTLSAGATGERNATSTAFDVSKAGWYVDLPDSKERINTDPALALGALIFTSNIPTTDVCTPGGSSWLNVLDYKTGGKLTDSTVAWSSMSLGNALASRPVIIKLPSGDVKALVRKSDATTQTVQVPVPASSSTGRRISWRELIQE